MLSNQFCYKSKLGLLSLLLYLSISFWVIGLNNTHKTTTAKTKSINVFTCYLIMVFTDPNLSILPVYRPLPIGTTPTVDPVNT